MRPTPFGLVFTDLAREWFPGVAQALEREHASAADRDRFVLLEPVGRLLREVVPAEAGPDALEAHVRMLHHAYRHWEAGGWVYGIGALALERAAGDAAPFASRLPHPAVYLQLPELRVWGSPTAEGGAAAEPLDGVFVTETARPGEIAALGVFGMRLDRPGFSAVGVEGRADSGDPTGTELLVATEREDGSARFSTTLAGGAAAGIRSLASAGELLLLTCRLLAVLPESRDEGRETRKDAARDAFVERIIAV